MRSESLPVKPLAPHSPDPAFPTATMGSRHCQRQQASATTPKQLRRPVVFHVMHPRCLCGNDSKARGRGESSRSAVEAVKAGSCERKYSLRF